MDLDLDRMLQTVRDGQWSVDDFDWSQPLAGADRLTPRQRREAGLSLLFTAGLERQAAKVFALAAEFQDDPRAAAIYRLFEQDELRHAEAEVRLAARYGATWRDLPRGARWMFRELERDFERADRVSLYELSTATIVLFELALDSLLIPALKASTDDPLQAEVFRRIDIDESRHLAMDYWLLDKKGAAYAGRTVDDLFRERHGRDRTLVERAVARLRLARALLTFVVGFAATDLAMPSIREATLRPETMGKYLRRVRAVPKKAPHALDVPTFRMGLRGQRMLLDALSRLSGRGRFDPREFAA